MNRPPATFLTWRFLLSLTGLVVVLFASCLGPATGTIAPPAATALPPTITGSPGSATRIYAPGTPASVPIVMAIRQMDNAQVTIFSNHSQANTLFLRGDIDILVTGLSVGVEFFKNGAPVQVINCNVTGLTYLVTYGRQMRSFADLKGQQLYLPFEGSPIEETSQFFAQRAGLIWKTDIMPVYAAFDSSVALLRQGKLIAVALPEPYVTLVEKQPNVFVSLNYKEQWDALTGRNAGYPQVCAFVKKPWADAHPAEIARFNHALQSALTDLGRDPASAASATQAELKQPADVLTTSLGRTDFALYTGQEMADQIRRYYQTIGKSLDASFASFFYRIPE